MKRTMWLMAGALVVSGCGGGAPEVEAQEPEGPNLPACDDVWVLDRKLPEDYRGCVNRAGEGVPSSFMNCGDGSGWGGEYLYWFEDGPLRYVAWSADEHDYPVEWLIEDGNVIGTNSGERMIDTARDVCREP